MERTRGVEEEVDRAMERKRRLCWAVGGRNETIVMMKEIDVKNLQNFTN